MWQLLHFYQKPKNYLHFTISLSSPLLTSDINKKIAFFCSEWRESGQCGASALALTTSPITLALENCSIRKPIQLVAGRENQGKNYYIIWTKKGKPKVGKSGMDPQKGMYYKQLLYNHNCCFS